MNNPITITTEQENIVLRQLATEADDLAYHESYNTSRPEIEAFEAPEDRGKYESLDDVRQARLDPSNPDRLRLGIWDGDTFVGSINLTPDDKGAEVGYWLDSRQTGHGYATIATRALAAFGLGQYDRLHANVVEGNDASARVLERSGFSQTARTAGKLIFELSHETDPSPEVNPHSWPVGYFDAQVRFAQKWSQISGEDFAEVLLKKTALYRRVMGESAPEGVVPEEWATLLAGANQTSNPAAVTQLLYDKYLQHPDSKYTDSAETSAFGYDYFPDTRTVKIHFTNPVRGESPLSDANLPKRQTDLRALLEEVKAKHPEAEALMSATWLRSTRRYRNLSPPDIAEQINLMSPDMKLTGNSVWGQFMDAYGNTNQRVYDQFVEAINEADSLNELMAAFPYKTLKAVDPIDKYYDFYGLDSAGRSGS